MQRRHLLSLSAVGLAALAGCSGGTDSQPDGNETPTSTSTPTPTPTPQPPTFEVVRLDVPERVSVGSSYQVEVDVRNTGDQAGTYTADLYAQTVVDGTRSEWQVVANINLEIPPGETATYTSNTATVQEGGYQIEWRVGETGRTQTTSFEGSTAPRVEFVNLVTSWDTFGDARENAITSANAGTTITIAWRHWYYFDTETYHVFEQTNVYNEENERVGSQTFEDEQVTNESGSVQYEHAMTFDSRGWGPGQYQAEVYIRDEGSGEVSDPGYTTFNLV